MVGTIEPFWNLNAVTPGGFSSTFPADPKAFADALARHGAGGSGPAPALQHALYNPGAQPGADLLTLVGEKPDSQKPVAAPESGKADTGHGNAAGQPEARADDKTPQAAAPQTDLSTKAAGKAPPSERPTVLGKDGKPIDVKPAPLEGKPGTLQPDRLPQPEFKLPRRDITCAMRWRQCSKWCNTIPLKTLKAACNIYCIAEWAVCAGLWPH